jgi:gas vesicle protein
MASAAVGGADEEGKRVRALQKKLRQIQQLKERRDKEGESLGACLWGCGCAEALTVQA